MLEIILGLINEVLQLHPILIAIFLVIIIVIAFKVLKFAMRAVLTGICFSLFPIAATFLGFSFPITLQSLLWFAIFGVIVYLAYHTLVSGYKIMKIALSPFSKLGAKKQRVKTVVVKEKKEK